nr:MAG TPA: hypothetical protein [Caudoviricetes sp.]
MQTFYLLSVNNENDRQLLLPGLAVILHCQLM